MARTTITPQAIDNFLQREHSPLAGLGRNFVAEGARTGLDPRLLVAVTGAETSFGTTGNAMGIRNPFGLGPGKRYASVPAAIAAAADNLAGRLYKGSGLRTIPKIQGRWAPSGARNDPTGLNNNWTKNVSRYLAALGGDPSADVFSGAPGGPPLSAGLAAPTAGVSQFPLPPSQGQVTTSDPLQDKLLQDILYKQFGSPLIAAKLFAERNPTTSPTVAGPPAPTPLGVAGAGQPATIDLKLLKGHPLDRPGATTAQSVIDFAAKVAGVYGKPITLGTGTAHNQYVKGTRRQSAHWTGHAIDLPATGGALTHMGQSALVAAGADPAWARKQTGGVYNIGGYNILFNTNEGGNHYNHLHIGERH